MSKASQCATCGVERDGANLPDVCPICADERQYLPADGRQRWVKSGDFPNAHLLFEEAEPGVHLIRQRHAPGIGQTPYSCALMAETY